MLRKKKAATNNDDVFADDLFDAAPVVVKPNAKTGTQLKASASTATERVSRVKCLEPEERERVFNQWLTHVQQRVGRRPEVEQAPRKTIFNILLSLATTREQAEEVVDLIPKFIASKRQLPSSFSECFARA